MYCSVGAVSSAQHRNSELSTSGQRSPFSISVWHNIQLGKSGFVVQREVLVRRGAAHFVLNRIQRFLSAHTAVARFGLDPFATNPSVHLPNDISFNFPQQFQQAFSNLRSSDGCGK
jgi:hypothetical protein